MTPREIEQMVFELEEVRIVIRASVNAELGDYEYSRKAAGSASITEWLQQRIYPIIEGYDVVVTDGTGAIPHGRTKMETLRSSYGG
ncbi:hypothetical protein [Rhodospirillum rubrum]|uniref:hypothetical protein n=1 Tax=Rhodospirillum rubrum TaxID=1085 RepID=UPI000229D449|nr:hypothetical protein [Rhodospirillum rubrum]AEO48680.1 hypothetical protein F11_11080 [Rhodospirillum rubrum F11]MBK5954575.1 hypothetical protein [Rhodospirillum rubrum]QXG78936.1 hypothetical protein KUL73_11125 [Rhodospirillum rubrum]